MKRLAHYLVLLGLLLPSSAGAVDAGIDATTLFRFEQRSVPGFPKQTIIPATQFIGADLDKLADGNLAFHIYGWGRVDLADRSTGEGSTDGDLTYGYLSYRFPRANGQIRAGRFFVIEGVATEQIDGASVRADLSRYLGLSLFGGAPVKLDRDSKSKGDYIYGGRMNLRLLGMLDIGASALHEGNVTLDPSTGEQSNREMLGGDVWFSPVRMVDVSGHTYYNITRHAIAEHSYLLTVKPLKVLTMTGIYNKERFSDYFTFSNLPSLFNARTGDKLESYGGSVSWVVAKPLEVIGDYRHYKRDSLGKSDRYGVEARVGLLDNKMRSGVAFHRSRGGDAINAYSEVRAYGTYRGTKYHGSLDGIAHFYDHAIDGKSNAFEIIASAGYRIIPDLLVSGDISYGENPRLSSELRGLVKLTYNFNYASKGAKP